MKYVDTKIARAELEEMSKRMFGGLVKAVVDVKKNVMVVDAAMHADQEKDLLDRGSNQEDLWGINLYPDESGDDFVEFDSMINIRPQQDNFSRDIENESLRTKIHDVVTSLVEL